MFEIESGIIFWNTVSFLILVFLMYRWALPPLVKVLKERQKTIADSLAQAEENKKISENMIADAKHQLSEANRNAQKTVDNSKEEGDQVKEEIVESARRDAELIVLRAREDVERERKEMVDNLRRQIGDLVVAAAGRVVGKVITAEDNRAIIEEELK